ncbi:hypothetical protein DLREEDagr8_47980 [Dongia sp. agr-C8]
MAGAELGLEHRIVSDRRRRRHFLALVVEAHHAPLHGFIENGAARSIDGVQRNGAGKCRQSREDEGCRKRQPTKSDAHAKDSPER